MVSVQLFASFDDPTDSKATWQLGRFYVDECRALEAPPDAMRLH